MPLILAGIACAAYLLAAWTIARSNGTAKALAPASIAIIAHSAALALGIIQDGSISIGLAEALSLFAWQAALLLLAYSVATELQVLGAGVYPVAAAAAVGAGIWATSVTAIPLQDWKIQLHVLLSLFSGGFLTLGAAQAVLLAYQDRRLHRASSLEGMSLPPLETMESLLFQLIGIGFFMLSLSLVTGLLFVSDLLGQHLTHKTVLTMLAWAVFGALLWGRWQRGWRGRSALRWTLSGYGILILGYFGSKFVLEQILGRHWS